MVSKIYKLSLLLLSLFFIPGFGLNAHKQLNYYRIDGQYEDNNVIKLWYTVLGLLDEYDKGENAGFEIKFNQDGKHFSPEHGSNWWNYYFAFNTIGASESSPIIRIPRYQRSIIRFKTVCTMPPERANFLLNKYMHLQPCIQTKVEQLVSHYFLQNLPIVGVYYQHPIISEVQADWSAQELCARVKHEIKKFENCKICLFTELSEFKDIFSQEFGSQLILIPDLVNSHTTNAAERGAHELLTLLLLARCNNVIAPGSYQGIGAKMLNPNLELIELDTIPYACE